MTTRGWYGNIESGGSATFNPAFQVAVVAPGQTLLRSLIWINSTALSPDPYTYAGVAFPFMLLYQPGAASPQTNPFTNWGEAESGIVLWRSMLQLKGSLLVPGGGTASYASESSDPQGSYETAAMRKNSTDADYYVWLVGQVDTAVTVGDVFTAMAATCLIQDA